MTTEQEAKKERNGGIGFGLLFGLFLMVGGTTGYFYLGLSSIASSFMLICALLSLKIAYDAYSTPLLYVRQRISLINTYKEQEAALKRTHRISKYSFWR